ncbi:MAG: hypothetical protein IPK76_02785 [Lewinellaceae bacterium]|nr:hypothetical protein [Lewinellaceae bacterium]
MKHIILLLLLFISAPLLAQQRFVQEFRTERNDGAVGVQQVENNAFLMLNQRFGLTGADSFGINLTKMSDLGRQRWSRDYNFDFPVLAGDLAWWPEKNAYLVSASPAVDSVRDNIVARFNTLGGLEWARRLDTDSLVQPENTGRSKIVVLPDSTFVVAAGAGSVTNLPGENDILLSKLDENGELLWSRRYCFSCLGDNDALLGDLIQTSDGGFLISGSVRSELSFGAHWDALLIKTDSAGQISWTRSYDANSIANVYELKAWNLAEPKPGQYLWTGDFIHPDSADTDGVFVLVNASDTIPFATRWNLAGSKTQLSTFDLLLQDTSGKGLWSWPAALFRIPCQRQRGSIIFGGCARRQFASRLG